MNSVDACLREVKTCTVTWRGERERKERGGVKTQVSDGEVVETITFVQGWLAMVTDEGEVSNPEVSALEKRRVTVLGKYTAKDKGCTEETLGRENPRDDPVCGIKSIATKENRQIRLVRDGTVTERVRETEAQRE